MGLLDRHPGDALRLARIPLSATIQRDAYLRVVKLRLARIPLSATMTETEGSGSPELRLARIPLSATIRRGSA